LLAPLQRRGRTWLLRRRQLERLSPGRCAGRPARPSGHPRLTKGTTRADRFYLHHLPGTVPADDLAYGRGGKTPRAEARQPGDLHLDNDRPRARPAGPTRALRSRVPCGRARVAFFDRHARADRSRARALSPDAVASFLLGPDGHQVRQYQPLEVKASAVVADIDRALG